MEFIHWEKGRKPVTADEKKLMDSYAHAWLYAYGTPPEHLRGFNELDLLSHHVVAKEGNRIIGGMRLENPEQHEIDWGLMDNFERIGISKEDIGKTVVTSGFFVSKGVGIREKAEAVKRIIGNASKLGLDLGKRHVILRALEEKKHLQKLYDRLGFTNTGIVFTDPTNLRFRIYYFNEAKLKELSKMA